MPEAYLHCNNPFWAIRSINTASTALPTSDNLHNINSHRIKTKGKIIFNQNSYSIKINKTEYQIATFQNKHKRKA